MCVSTLPANFGERVVLRLLDKQAGRLKLEKLGLAPHTLEALQQTVGKPYGIFLVTAQQVPAKPRRFTLRWQSLTATPSTS